MIFCSNCGKPVHEDDAFCMECGTKVILPSSAVKSSEASTQEAPITAPVAETPAEPVVAEEPATVTAEEPAFEPMQKDIQALKESFTESAQPVSPVNKIKGRRKKPKDPNKIKGKKKNLIIAIVAALFVVVVALALIFGLHYKQQVNAYNEGVELLNGKFYDMAYDKFDTLGDFKDAPELKEYAANSIVYENAETAFNEQNFETALKLYGSIPGFADANEKHDLCLTCIEYKKAEEFYGSSQWADAKECYDSVGDYQDAKEKAESCANHILYDEACELMDDYDFTYARELFLELGDFLDASQLAKDCESWETYYEAQDYLGIGEPEEALALFETLDPSFNDVQHQIDVCNGTITMRNTLDDLRNGGYGNYTSLPEVEDDVFLGYSDLESEWNNWKDYYAALQLFNDGNYYQAQNEFEWLSYDMADVAEKVEACNRPYPSTQQIYRNPGYSGTALDLKIVPPSDGTANFIRIYDLNDNLVLSAFINPGATITVSLPAGTYKIKDAYSDGTWYGEKDMFGPYGEYETMLIGDSEYFTLEGGYIYTLSLRIDSSVEDGTDVGSDSESWEDAMD